MQKKQKKNTTGLCSLKISHLNIFLVLWLLPLWGISAADSVIVGTWNVRQLSTIKAEREIHVTSEDRKMPIKNLISEWIQTRDVDVLAMQEVYEEQVLSTEKRLHPMTSLREVLPKHYKIIKGESIRAPIAKGKDKVWREYCPIIYNSQRVNCYTSKDSMVPTNLKNQKGVEIEELRRGHWAYCQTLDKQFDFVFTCLHLNYRHAKADLIGLQTVIQSVLTSSIDLPPEISMRNRDFIFAGDYNLDRRGARAFDRWKMEVGEDYFELDKVLPKFPKGTVWESKSFTKLKDIYNFEELTQRSSVIYDDVVGTPSVLESLISKQVDPMVDSYFLKSNGKVDVESLLGLSDHLPVLAEYDTRSDTD